MSESQEYEYTPNPAAARVNYTLRKDGRWKRHHTVLMLGERAAYHDYSF